MAMEHEPGPFGLLAIKKTQEKVPEVMSGVHLTEKKMGVYPITFWSVSSAPFKRKFLSKGYLIRPVYLISGCIFQVLHLEFPTFSPYSFSQFTSFTTSLILPSTLTFLQIIRTQASNFKFPSTKIFGEVLVRHSPARQKVRQDKEQHIHVSLSFLKERYYLPKTMFLPDFVAQGLIAEKSSR